jgi:hypothetical protein
MAPHARIALIAGVTVFGLQDQDMTRQVGRQVHDRHLDQAVS